MINEGCSISQGMGETFGRVTIEAMAFGLPVWTLTISFIKSAFARFYGHASNSPVLIDWCLGLRIGLFDTPPLVYCTIPFPSYGTGHDSPKSSIIWLTYCEASTFWPSYGLASRITEYTLTDIAYDTFSCVLLALVFFDLHLEFRGILNHHLRILPIATLWFNYVSMFAYQGLLKLIFNQSLQCIHTPCFHWIRSMLRMRFHLFIWLLKVVMVLFLVCNKKAISDDRLAFLSLWVRCLALMQAAQKRLSSTMRQVFYILLVIQESNNLHKTSNIFSRIHQRGKEWGWKEGRRWKRCTWNGICTESLPCSSPGAWDKPSAILRGIKCSFFCEWTSWEDRKWLYRSSTASLFLTLQPNNDST